MTPIANTPIRDMSFTPIHGFDNHLSMAMSPAHNMGGMSPFPGSQTPAHQTPKYMLGGLNSSFSPNLMGGSSMRFGDGRNSGYPGLPGSSSPSYTNRMMSASPNYSPTSSHHSSPSYSPRADSNRQ